MNQTPDLETRLLAVIAEVGLSLSEAQRCAYIADLVRSIPDNCTDAQLQRLILYYHEHHELVQSLRDVTHPHHWLAWTTWSKRVIAILRQRGLDWSRDIAVERHDLVQVALQALQGALTHYRYESAFSTWAYAVASHAVQNYLRGLQTIQRDGQPLSLEQLTAERQGQLAPPPLLRRITPSGQAVLNLLTLPRHLLDAVFGILESPRWVTAGSHTDSIVLAEERIFTGQIITLSAQPRPEQTWPIALHVTPLPALQGRLILQIGPHLSTAQFDLHGRVLLTDIPHTLLTARDGFDLVIALDPPSDSP